MNRFAVRLTTLVFAALLLVAGDSHAGAVAANSYNCGTYGSGTYDSSSCSSAPAASAPPTSTPSSSPNGATTSASAPSASADIVLNNYPEFSQPQGKSLAFKVGDVIYFYLNGLKEPIVVKSFSAASLTLTVGQSPVDVTVLFNQKVPYDANGDGIPDISFEYTALSTDSKSASATFRALSNAASAVTTPAPTTGVSGTTSGSSTGATIHANSVKGFWWIWLFPIILGSGLVVLAIRTALRRRRAAATSANASLYGNHF